MVKIRKSPAGWEPSFCQGLIIYEYDLDAQSITKGLDSIRRVNRKSEIRNSKPFLFRSPALAHQFKQVGQGLVVTAAFLLSQLCGPLVELGGHLGGFFLRTAKGDEQGGELD